MELADFFFAGSVFDRTTPILRIRRRGGGGSAAKSKIIKNGEFLKFQNIQVIFFKSISNIYILQKKNGTNRSGQ